MTNVARWQTGHMSAADLDNLIRGYLSLIQMRALRYGIQAPRVKEDDPYSDLADQAARDTDAQLEPQLRRLLYPTETAIPGNQSNLSK